MIGHAHSRVIDLSVVQRMPAVEHVSLAKQTQCNQPKTWT